jgi:hypothetical protein
MQRRQTALPSLQANPDSRSPFFSSLSSEEERGFAAAHCPIKNVEFRSVWK